MAPSNTEETYKKTLARIETIQSHLNAALRSGRLRGKVCVITGVNSLKGIGRASALLYAHEGARHLYLLDFATENLSELKATIRRRYSDVKVTTLQADASEEGTIKDVCEKILREEGRLDVFFANAGIVNIAGGLDMTGDSFMKTLKINTLSVFLAIKHASATMLKGDQRGGSIILTASVAGLRAGAGHVDYSASKAAVISLAQTSVYQLRDTDIRVNAICPGLIETGMTSFTFDAARVRGTAGKIGHLNPLGRYGVSEEVAQMALFLASDDSSYVNGQAIAVDGGLTASMPVVPGKTH